MVRRLIAQAVAVERINPTFCRVLAGLVVAVMVVQPQLLEPQTQVAVVVALTAAVAYQETAVLVL
jgi:hypothetical protein